MSNQEEQQGWDTSMYYDPEQTAELRSQGFEAGEGIWEFNPLFTLDELFHSVATSTYSNPITVGFDPQMGKLPPMRVVIQKIESLYTAYDAGTNKKPLGCVEYPSWKLEGWVMKSDFDPFAEVIRVRACIDTSVDGSFFIARGQRIPENPDPDGLLTWAR